MEKKKPRLVKVRSSFSIGNLYDNIVDTFEDTWLIHGDTIKNLLTYIN